MKRSELVFVFLSFIIWRIGILIIAFMAIKYVPLFSKNFLGGSYSNYQMNPLFWGHLNFDGEHYLSIAQNGYRPLQYFFLPFFPYLIKILAASQEIVNLARTGLIVSSISFLIALLGVYKLIRIDYTETIAKLTVILFLIFPTSFYFGNYYTESLFLALVVWSLFFARKRKFLFASIIAAFASATRIIGVTLFPVLFFELILQKKKNFLPILISPFGIFYYMYYLYKQTGDPLIFLHEISIYGDQRSSSFILLPQVIYRYLFKIFPVLPYNYFPMIFTTYLESGITIIFLILIIIAVFKLRISYSLYAVLTLIIPTLSGSFSSMPRYVLAIFPVFLIIGLLINKISGVYKYVIFSGMLILLVIAEALFWRGYWVS